MNAHSHNRRPPSTTPSRSSTILVVDDSITYRKTLRAILGKTYKVIEAANGEECLEAARQYRPDVILLDVCLDGSRSGFEILEALKASLDTVDIQVIVISGMNKSAEDELRAQKAGAAYLMAKSEISEGPKDDLPLIRRIKALLLKKANYSPISHANNASTSSIGVDDSPHQAEKEAVKYTLLVIDDEKETANLLSLYLEKEPYRVVWASSGADGLRIAASELPDLITLDLNMPDIPGQEVCRRLREQQKPFRVPILILTGNPQIAQQVHCLSNLGADDYIVKMPNPLQMKAKLDSLIQRVRFGSDAKGIIRLPGVTLDTRQRKIAVSEQEGVEITKTETALMAMLMSASGKPVDKGALHKKLYNTWPPPNSNVIKVNVTRIRKKLGCFQDLVEGHRDGSYRFNIEYAEQLISRKPSRRN